MKVARATAAAAAAGLVMLAACGCGTARVTVGQSHPVPATSAAAPAQVVVRVADYGARPDDGQDDSAGIQAALDAAPPGSRVQFESGTYQHSTMLVARRPGVEIVGDATRLVATVESDSAFRVDADRVVVQDLTFGISNTTRRWSAPQQHKVWVSGHTGVVLRDVSITGSAAAGVFVDSGAEDFRLEKVTVADTRADGIHITGGSHDGAIVDATVSRTGDDAIAVVSYDTDSGPTHSITVTSPTVLGTQWARGLSVVGGYDVTFTDIYVQDSNGAAVYVAVEGAPYFTRDVAAVTVQGGKLVRSNVDPERDRGAVVVFNGRPTASISGVAISDLTITDTRETASQNISVITQGRPPQNLSFTDLSVAGGPKRIYGGNVPQSMYRVVG